MSAPGNYNAMELYPLRSLATVLPRFQPPRGAFDPAGSWRNVYGVYTLASRTGPAARRVGSLAVERSAGSDGQAAWKVSYGKTLAGGTQKVSGELHGPADDALAAPRSWSFRIRLLDGAGRALARANVDGRAACRDGEVTVAYGAQRRAFHVPGRYTVNWCLFDAVQRLGGKGRKPISFTLIDHFDQPKPGTSLAFRAENVVAVAGGRALRTQAYEQLGPGNVPWVYWVDGRGQLLFVVAGLEGYVLETKPAGGKP